MSRSAFDQAFDELAEPELSVALTVRDSVREVVQGIPRVSETTKWNYAAWVHEGKRGNICSIMGAKGYVRLQFFRGTELPDAESRLEGTGKGMRHIKVWCNRDFPKAEIQSLVRDALQLHAGQQRNR